MTTNSARFTLAAMAALAMAGLTGCVKVQVDPVEVEVKPIHVIVDVNIRVDRQLDNFFAFDEKPSTQPAATQPAEQKP